MAQKKYLDNTGLSRFLDNIMATFSKKGHTHTKSQITDFAHNHDERYYTESEMDSKLSWKADSVHTHSKSQITDFPTSMPASDVYAWAKKSTKPAYTKSEVGLGNVDNTADANKSVKYAASAGTASYLSANQLTSENLNDVKTTGTYYAGGSNTVTNKPSGVDAFGLTVQKTASGYTTQILIEGNTCAGKTWVRQYNASSWSDWGYYYSTLHKPTPSAIGAAASSHTHTKSQITDFPSSMKNPNALTISLNGTSQGAYDGSATKSVNITSSAIGAAASGHTHDDRYYTETEIDDKLNGKAAKSHTHTADDITSVNASAITGVIAAAQLPSYVDDVLEYNGTANFPKTGEAGKIYTDTSTNKIYRWGGSGYVIISDTIALGENSSTAYRGDRGKVAYDHSQVTSGNPHNVTKSEVGLGNVDNTADADKSVKKAATANSATKLATSRKLMTKLDATSAASFDGSADANAIGVTGTLPVSNGGTGATSVGGIRYNIGIDPVTTTGTGAAYAANVNGITSLSAGASFIMVPHTQSTVTNPTLNVNGLGAKTIRVQLSNSSSTAVPPAQSNFLGPNKPVEMMYNGTMWVAQLIRPDSNGIYGQVPITSGGTGASTAAQARQNLGITTASNTVLSQNADYAEVGEWADGNSSNEDRIGYFVAIDNSSAGATMVKASSTSDVRGVTVAAPAFSSNCSSDKFDSDGALLKQYDYVTVMGMVSVIDNGKCTINGRCMPTDDGTAVPSPNNMGYQIISRIDDTHVLIVVEPEADMIVRIKSDIEELQDGLPVFSYGADKPTSNTGGCFYIQYS